MAPNTENGSRMREGMERLWPLGLLGAGFVPVFPLLLWFLSDALAAAAQMRTYLSNQRGGPEVLFVLVAGAFGWFSVVVVEHRLGTTGAVLLWIIVPACLLTVAAGFGAATMLFGSLSDPQWEMSGVSAVTAILASLVRLFGIADT